MAPPEERYTAFTGALISVLEQGLPNEKQTLSLGDLYRGVVAKLKDKPKIPKPEPASRLDGEKVIFARNAHYRVDLKQQVQVLGDGFEELRRSYEEMSAQMKEHQSSLNARLKDIETEHERMISSGKLALRTVEDRMNELVRTGDFAVEKRQGGGIFGRMIDDFLYVAQRLHILLVAAFVIFIGPIVTGVAVVFGRDWLQWLFMGVVGVAYCLVVVLCLSRRWRGVYRNVFGYSLQRPVILWTAILGLFLTFASEGRLLATAIEHVGLELQLRSPIGSVTGAGSQS